MNDDKLLNEILSSLEADVKTESFNRSKYNKNTIK
jgi:hypothetical protein